MLTLPIDPQDAHAFIVEDNRDNLEIVQILLRDAGVNWQKVSASGKMLFKWINDSDHMRLNPGFQLHLILLDINIVGEDGFQVLQQIRRHPRVNEALVVAVTANVLPRDVERARAAGFDGFIGKPIDRHRFADQIRRILNGEAVWEPH